VSDGVVVDIKRRRGGEERAPRGIQVIRGD
jgi:hypothetical protein